MLVEKRVNFAEEMYFQSCDQNILENERSSDARLLNAEEEHLLGAVTKEEMVEIFSLLPTVREEILGNLAEFELPVEKSESLARELCNGQEKDIIRTSSSSTPPLDILAGIATNEPKQSCLQVPLSIDTRFSSPTQHAVEDLCQLEGIISTLIPQDKVVEPLTKIVSATKTTRNIINDDFPTVVEEVFAACDTLEASVTSFQQYLSSKKSKRKVTRSCYETVDELQKTLQDRLLQLLHLTGYEHENNEAMVRTKKQKSSPCKAATVVTGNDEMGNKENVENQLPGEISSAKQKKNQCPEDPLDVFGHHVPATAATDVVPMPNTKVTPKLKLAAMSTISNASTNNVVPTHKRSGRPITSSQKTSSKHT